MNTPLSSSGRSVVAAVALVLCSPAPAWVTDVPETSLTRESDPGAVRRHRRGHQSPAIG